MNVKFITIVYKNCIKNVKYENIENIKPPFSKNKSFKYKQEKQTSTLYIQHMTLKQIPLIGSCA